MTGFESEQVMNGTYGQVWSAGVDMAEENKFSAEVAISYDDIKQARKLMDGKKMVSMSGSGSVTMAHVSSYMTNLLSDALKAGRVPDITIVGKLDDPSAIGGERVALYHCKFDKLTLMNWEHGKSGEDEAPFTFENWDILDKTK